MKISVVIPYYENSPKKRAMLKKAVKSINGADEVILVWNDGAGFSRAVNIGYQLATGDYIVMMSDDCFIKTGSLRDLAVPNTVTSPALLQEPLQEFSGVMWCVPRDIYERYGMLDEGFSEGIYYEDEDYLMRMKAEGIKYKKVGKVLISHEHGGSTLVRVPERDEKIQKNLDYFKKKWGLNG